MTGSPSPGTPGRAPLSIWAKAGVVIAALGAEDAAAWWHPWLGVIEAVADAAAVVTIAGIVAMLLARGSDRTWERLFRLLRWARGQAEPPGPLPGTGGPVMIPPESRPRGHPGGRAPRVSVNPGTKG
jgi:hypothetical protein